MKCYDCGEDCLRDYVLVDVRSEDGTEMRVALHQRCFDRTLNGGIAKGDTFTVQVGETEARWGLHTALATMRLFPNPDRPTLSEQFYYLGDGYVEDMIDRMEQAGYRWAEGRRT